MPTTTGYGTQTPTTGDAVNVPGDVLTVVNHYDPVVVNPFATATARNAAITAPFDGQLCSVAGVLQKYRAGAWRPMLDQDQEFPGFTACTLASGISAVAATVGGVYYRQRGDIAEVQVAVFVSGGLSTTATALTTATAGLGALVNPNWSNLLSLPLAPIAPFSSAVLKFSVRTDGTIYAYATSSTGAISVQGFGQWRIQ